ncbi:hypothetical protein HY311_04070 [Candidatus Nomurabacteria bacterium]|nr:hypothetical protein [Candidatus Nomurabacteria bacterium]
MFFKDEEWMNFFQSLGEIIKVLLSLDPFGKNLMLRNECQEVLGLLNNQKKDQGKKYSSLINKLSDFLDEKGVKISERLP